MNNAELDKQDSEGIWRNWAAKCKRHHNEEPKFDPYKDEKVLTWKNHPYILSKGQMAAIRVLYDHLGEVMSEHNIFKEMRVDSNRLSDIFKKKGKMHPLWGTLVALDGRRCFHLDINADPPPENTH